MKTWAVTLMLAATIGTAFAATTALAQNYRVKQYLVDQICVGAICKKERFRFSVDKDIAVLMGVDDSSQKIVMAVDTSYRDQGFEYILVDEGQGLIRIDKTRIDMIVEHVYVSLRIRDQQTHWQW